MKRSIAADDLTYRVGGAEILRGVSFSIDHGAYACLLGPNGAGKTTLLKCLNRIYAAPTGAIRVLEKPLESYSQRNLAKMVGYVPQFADFDLPFSVFDYVLLGRYPHLSPFSTVSESDKAAVHEALAQVGLSSLETREIATLSGGERQAALVAAALAQGAGILLLDEPAAHLDFGHQFALWDLLARLNEENGLTIVCVTHDIGPHVARAGQIIGLKGGEKVFDGTPDRFYAERAADEIYETAFHYVDEAMPVKPLIHVRWEDA